MSFFPCFHNFFQAVFTLTPCVTVTCWEFPYFSSLSLTLKSNDGEMLTLKVAWTCISWLIGFIFPRRSRFWLFLYGLRNLFGLRRVFRRVFSPPEGARIWFLWIVSHSKGFLQRWRHQCIEFCIVHAFWQWANLRCVFAQVSSMNWGSWDRVYFLWPTSHFFFLPYPHHPNSNTYQPWASSNNQQTTSPPHSQHHSYNTTPPGHQPTHSSPSNSTVSQSPSDVSWW